MTHRYVVIIDITVGNELLAPAASDVEAVLRNGTAIEALADGLSAACPLAEIEPIRPARVPCRLARSLHLLTEVDMTERVVTRELREAARFQPEFARVIFELDRLRDVRATDGEMGGEDHVRRCDQHRGQFLSRSRASLGTWRW